MDSIERILDDKQSSNLKTTDRQEIIQVNQNKRKRLSQKILFLISSRKSNQNISPMMINLKN